MESSPLPKRPVHSASAPGTRVNLVRAFTKKGVASRTQARDWILTGRVKVNGRVEKMIYAWVDLNLDEICLDDQPLDQMGQKLYVLFHKPAGYLTVRIDQEKRPTVYDLLPEFSSWIFPVGRLDQDSEGLLLLTNDGPFGEWLTHPDSHIEKTYRVRIDKPLQEQDRLQLENGIDLHGYLTRPAKVIPIIETNGNWLDIIISEGKNRQVRRMLQAVDYHVLRLIRTRIGPIRLGDLKSGQWRYMTPAEKMELEQERSTG